MKVVDRNSMPRRSARNIVKDPNGPKDANLDDVTNALEESVEVVNDVTIDEFIAAAEGHQGSEIEGDGTATIHNEEKSKKEEKRKTRRTATTTDNKYITDSLSVVPATNNKDVTASHEEGEVNVEVDFESH